MRLISSGKISKISTGNKEKFRTIQHLIIRKSDFQNPFCILEMGLSKPSCREPQSNELLTLESRPNILIFHRNWSTDILCVYRYSRVKSWNSLIFTLDTHTKPLYEFEFQHYGAFVTLLDYRPRRYRPCSMNIVHYFELNLFAQTHCPAHWNYAKKRPLFIANIADNSNGQQCAR